MPRWNAKPPTKSHLESDPVLNTKDSASFYVPPSNGNGHSDENGAQRVSRPRRVPDDSIQPGEVVARFKAWLSNYTGQPKTGGMSVSFSVTSDQLAAVFPLTALTGLMFEVSIIRPYERDQRTILEMAEREAAGQKNEWDDLLNVERVKRMDVDPIPPGMKPPPPPTTPDAPTRPPGLQDDAPGLGNRP